MDSKVLGQCELKDRLIALIRRVAYREGDFTLASGQKSSFYIDIKTASLHPEGADLIGQGAVKLLTELSPPETIGGVGGLTLGADPLGTAVSLAALRKGMHWPAFIVRKEAKGHGTSKFIEGADNLKPGARVIVLEDVVTTGGSSLIAVERLRSGGLVPLAVLTVVDRESGGRERILNETGLPLLSLVTWTEIQQAGSPRKSG